MNQHTRPTTAAALIRGQTWLLVALGAIAGGLALRGLWHGPVARWGGELLYAVMIYALFAPLPAAIWTVLRWYGVRTRPRPTIRPAIFAMAAFSFCAAIEVFQLSGIPATLGAHNKLWWLLLGSGFSKGDLLFYLIGSICAVGIHHGLALSARKQSTKIGPEPDVADEAQGSEPMARNPARGSINRSLIVAVVVVVTLALAAGATAIAWRAQTTAPAEAGPAGQGERVQPEGVPYSYTVPPGWIRAVKQPQPATLLTSVGPPPDAEGHYTTEIVSVQIRNTPATGQWRQTVEHIYRQITSGNGSALGSRWTTQQITAPAGPAWMATYVDPQGVSPGGRYVFFDKPADAPVIVMAQWIDPDDKDSALWACDQVVQTLTIK